ncbi:MAG: DUF1232 domain-containing protein, partial [Pseudomonadales bacterium]|nr:DUF1232 domain-containing protein [Pseudomonadales bacterium]
MVPGDREPPAFGPFRNRAETLLRDPQGVRRLGRSAMAKLGAGGPGLRAVADDLRTLLRLMGAWQRGEYRDLSPRSLVVVVAAVLYFVVPTDLVPDVLLAVGYLDDAAVIGWAMAAVAGEIEAFRRW